MATSGVSDDIKPSEDSQPEENLKTESKHDSEATATPPNEKGRSSDDSSPKKDAETAIDPEYGHLTEEEKAAIMAQTLTPEHPPKASFTSLFRYATWPELFLNSIGIVAAVAAGVAQVRPSFFFFYIIKFLLK